MASSTDIAWLAGLLEGEGCFRNPTPNRAQVNLASTDLDVVERAAEVMELPRERIKVVDMAKENPLAKKQLYKLYCCGDDARRVMREILPYMGYRRTIKIREILNG